MAGEARLRQGGEDLDGDAAGSAAAEDSDLGCPARDCCQEQTLCGPCSVEVPEEEVAEEEGPAEEEGALGERRGVSAADLEEGSGRGDRLREVSATEGGPDLGPGRGCCLRRPCKETAGRVSSSNCQGS